MPLKISNCLRQRDQSPGSAPKDVYYIFFFKLTGILNACLKVAYTTPKAGQEASVVLSPNLVRQVTECLNRIDR